MQAPNAKKQVVLRGCPKTKSSAAFNSTSTLQRSAWAPAVWAAHAHTLCDRYGGLMAAPSDARMKRLTLVACILGSGIALLDGTVVNVALPSIQRALGGGLAAQQWVSNGYLLTLGSLILVGGSLGDLYRRAQVFALGVAGFGVASARAPLSPSIGVLVAARALQGIAGALLVPSSLAVIVNTFPASERGGAIGTWTAWGAIAGVLGPLAGGELLAIALVALDLSDQRAAGVACVWLILSVIPPSAGATAVAGTSTTRARCCASSASAARCSR